MIEKFGSSIWRIPHITHTAPGGSAYVRAYGWGWLSWPGVVAIFAGAASLAFGPDAGWKLALVCGGFALVFAGVILNGFSERLSMKLVYAQCQDVEIQYLPSIHMDRLAGYAVRARMRYQFNLKDYEATPGRQGYVQLGALEKAEAFSRHLQSAVAIPLYIDPKHPTRALFKSLSPSAGKGAQ
ncbi:MAG: hypothetical protein M3O62_03965 [Pseudomonadota bacterium]|nr:hypothetical protein [Pseudomonadota bacterium]